MDDIKKIENQFNIKFPKAYVELINSEYIEYKNILVVLENENIKIKKFLSIESCDKENIIDEYSENKNLMLEGIIPIAITEYDDYICLYYIDSRDVEPKVIFWSYELAMEDLHEGIFEIANSFAEFTTKLRKS